MKATRLLSLGGGVAVALFTQLCAWAASDSPAADEAASVFSDRVVEFHLEVSPAGLFSLQAQPRRFVRATLREGSNAWAEAGLHLKGHASFQTLGLKPSFTLKLNEFRLGQRWHGLRKVHLNNSAHDGTYLCEYVGAVVARAAGVPCPRVGHARVRLNGRDLGLYVLVEGATRDFLDGQFGNHDGLLMEGEYQDIDRGLDTDGTGSKADTNLLARLVAAAREPEAPRRWERLGQVLDAASFARFMAVEALLRHSDGYTYAHSNYRLYQDPATGKLSFILHGMDNLFTLPMYPALHAARGLAARAFLDVPSGREVYLQQLASLATNVIWTELPQVIEERGRGIRPILAERGEAAAHDAAVRTLLERIRQRVRCVREELAAVPAGAWTNGALLTLKDLKPRPAARAQAASPAGAGSAISNLLAQAAQAGRTSVVRLWELHIAVSDAPAWQAAGQEATNWFSATVWDGEHIYPEVGVRLHGRSTRRPPRQRPSLTLKLNQWVPGQNFRGRTKVHLHNNLYDPSCLNEYLGYGVFRRAGLPAPEVQYAMVTINGQPEGLFVLVEGITRSFLERTLGNSGGNLYEGDLSDVDGRLDQDGGKRAEGGKDVLALVEAARRTDATNGLAELGHRLDLEAFARFMAAEILVGHVDGYCLRTNNYRLYRNETDGRFVFIPHGLDALFANPYAKLVPPMRGLLARTLLSSEDGKLLYIRALRQVLDEAFTLEQLTTDLVDVCAVIQPALWKYSAEAAQKQMKAAEWRWRLLQERRSDAAHQLRELESELGLASLAQAAKLAPVRK